MLQKLYELRKAIATFLENKTTNAAAFRDQEFVSNLAFLVDLTSRLNNMHLQLPR